MKKLCFVSLMMLLLSSLNLSAQGLYLRAGTGYGLPVATAQIGDKYLHIETYTGATQTTTNDYSTEIVSASYGAGPDFNLGFGYKFNENFILDLNVYYLLGRKFETSQIYTYTSDGFSGKSEDIFHTFSRGLYFNPSFIFSAGFGNRAPYGRVGIVATSPSVTRNEDYYYDLDGTNTINQVWKFKGGLAIGYQAAVGMNWKLTQKLDIFTELNFTSMSYYAKEGEMVKYIEDGADLLNQVPVAQKKTVFRKKFDPYTPYDENKPSVAPRQVSPFSSVSALAGIRFSFLKFSD